MDPTTTNRCPYADADAPLNDMLEHNPRTCTDCLIHWMKGYHERNGMKAMKEETASEVKAESQTASNSTALPPQKQRPDRSKPPEWYKTKERVKSLVAMHGMSKSDAYQLALREQREERIQGQKSSDIVSTKAKERIDQDKTCWKPSHAHATLAFANRRSVLNSSEQRRLVAMLLQYESDGRFRFQKQEHEYKEFSSRLREERDCFDQYVRDNILTDEVWNNRLAKSDKAQSTFAQKHCGNAIAAINHSIPKKYENFVELDTSSLGGVALRRGPKLLRLGGTGKLELPDMRMRQILSGDLEARAVLTCSVAEDENMKRLHAKYGSDVIIGASELRLIICLCHPITQEREFRIPFNVSADVMDAQCAVALFAKYALRKMFVKEMSIEYKKELEKKASKKPMPLSITQMSKAPSDEETSLAIDTNVHKSETSTECMEQSSTSDGAPQSTQQFSIDKLLSAITSARTSTADEATPSEAPTPRSGEDNGGKCLETDDDYTPVTLDKCYRYNALVLGSDERSLKILVRGKVHSRRRAIVDRREVTRTNPETAALHAHKWAGAEQVDSLVMAKPEYAADVGAEKWSLDEALFHYVSHVLCRTQETIVGSVLFGDVLAYRRLVAYNWNRLLTDTTMRAHVDDALGRAYNILDQMRQLDIGDYLLEINDGRATVAKATDEEDADVDLEALYDYDAHLVELVPVTELREFNGVDEMTVLAWQRMMSRVPGAFPPYTDKCPTNLHKGAPARPVVGGAKQNTKSKEPQKLTKSQKRKLAAKRKRMGEPAHAIYQFLDEPEHETLEDVI